MKYIYRVLVHDKGKDNYEEVRDFESDKKAFEYVKELRRKNKIGLESEHVHHFDNLDWVVEKRMRGED